MDTLSIATFLGQCLRKRFYTISGSITVANWRMQFVIFLSFFVLLLNQTGGLSVTMCNAFTLRDYAAQLFGVEIASGYSLFAKLLSLTLFESSLSLVHACVKRSR